MSDPDFWPRAESYGRDTSRLLAALRAERAARERLEEAARAVARFPYGTADPEGRRALAALRAALAPDASEGGAS